MVAVSESVPLDVLIPSLGGTVSGWRRTNVGAWGPGDQRGGKQGVVRRPWLGHPSVSQAPRVLYALRTGPDGHLVPSSCLAAMTTGQRAPGGQAWGPLFDSWRNAEKTG